jgi:beta-phosphoglucomutase-like phosphatase (HAD superfamily)
MTELLSEQQTNPEVLKEHPVIVVDIDGVLFDTPQHAVKRWNSIYGTDYKVEDIFDHNAVHNKDLFRHWHEDGIETDQDTGEKYDDGFYGAQKDVANYLLIPGAREILARLKHEYGASLHALTARKKANLGNVTLAALGEHFGVGEAEEHLIDELHFSGDPDHDNKVDENGEKIDLTDKGTYLREMLGAHIMVEDSVKNAISAKKAGVASFVLAQAYNQNGEHDWSAEETAPDWDTLYHLISKSLDDQGFRKVKNTI